jgi:hypothetical protein
MKETFLYSPLPLSQYFVCYLQSLCNYFFISVEHWCLTSMHSPQYQYSTQLYSNSLFRIKWILQTQTTHISTRFLVWF